MILCAALRFPLACHSREEFEPSRRLSETSDQRSVSAFPVAFHSAEATRRQLRSKRAGKFFTPRTPGLPYCRRRGCSVRWLTRRRESICTCYRAASTVERSEGLQCVRRGVVVDAGSDAPRVHTLRTGPVAMQEARGTPHSDIAGGNPAAAVTLQATGEACRPVCRPLHGAAFPG